MTTNSNSALPWYQEGLRFECTGCGGCCTGFPGYVWVTDEEIMLMAERMQMSFKDFSMKYTRFVDGRVSLRENAVSYDCVFLEDKKRCGLYDLRPKQCKTFPFWPQNIETPEAWNEIALHCEGIGPDRPIVNLETIQKNANA